MTTNVNPRMAIMRQSVERDVLEPLREHGWTAEIEGEFPDAGEYIIVSAKRDDVARTVAIMYTSATGNAVYKRLDRQVDCILIHGALYKLESFAYGISTQVKELDDFPGVILSWNREVAPTVERPAPKRHRTVREITAENPLEGIWIRLDQFASARLAEKLVRRRAEEDKVQLADDVVLSKATGIAFSLKNASDYFRSAPGDSLNKRILNLYYGALSLAFAEVLAMPNGIASLDGLDGITRRGHGLYMVSESVTQLGEIVTGIRGIGFFSSWLKLLGIDTSHFPKDPAKTEEDLQATPPGTFATLESLFAMIPELGDLFLEVFNGPPAWLSPSSDMSRNFLTRGEPKTSTYIQFVDVSGRISETRIRSLDWPITEIVVTSDVDRKRIFKARVDHPLGRTWWDVVPFHRSPYLEGASLILPGIGGITEYRAIVVTILYTLSILVRYMPGLWRRVEGGDWDHHLALVRASISIFERMLPEEFLGSIIGERISAGQPGRLF